MKTNLSQPRPLPLFLLITLLVLAACSPAAALDEPTPQPTIEPTHLPTIQPTNQPTPLPPLPTSPPPPLPTAAPTASPTAVPTPLPPQFSNPPDGQMEQTAVAFNAPFRRPDPADTGLWQYAEGNFIHPIALVARGGMAYLLDGGRVLALPLDQPAPPALLLAPGDDVAGVRVIEPLDLFAAPDSLLVLDRAGDVYRYDWAAQTWELDWYDRPIGDTSSHYYVALDGAGDGRYLLETSYLYAMQYLAGRQQALWMLPEGRAVDVAAVGENVYVLRQNLDDAAGSLHLYRATAEISNFRPGGLIQQPRQVVANETAVYVLDQNGRRLLAFAPDHGRLLELWQLPVGVSAIALSETGDLLLAGRDRLYFVNQPARLAAIPGGPTLAGPQPHDPDLLAAIGGYVSPLGPYLAARDLQMPGAPRHYRLGVHEGADFYWRLGAAVYAAADGRVIRADHEYSLPTPADFARWRYQAEQLGYTSPEALDFFRGRQIWLEHADGRVSRYAHLDSIEYAVQVGDWVTQGQLLGAVGNSGSPGSLEGEGIDAHLHFELWLNDHYLGQFLRPVETRDWLERILFGGW